VPHLGLLSPTPTIKQGPPKVDLAMLTPVPFLTAVPHVEKKQLILERQAWVEVRGAETMRPLMPMDGITSHTAHPSAT
jgi:hypothetical protein